MSKSVFSLRGRGLGAVRSCGLYLMGIVSFQRTSTMSVEADNEATADFLLIKIVC